MFDPKVLIDPYCRASYRLLPDGSYIVWRVGTGENVELLHLRVVNQNEGTGTALFRMMLEALRENPPYYTVFGFTRSSNRVAQAFYHYMGFDLAEVKGVYRDGSAILFSREYEDLCRLHNIPE
jgi:RimJ/RimL family protein N-acetyltransferase